MKKETSGEIVMYQPDETIRLEVRMGDDTVWLSANQMALLFDRDEKTIRKHINNVFSEQEVPKDINTHFLRVDGVKQPVAYYTLDVIISVGYRVKSLRGTKFRQWANKVLKDYLLKGYSINQRIERLEQRVSRTEDKIDFFVRTSLPPVEGIFYDGQIFDAYRFVSDLVRKATKSITLIDNYIDDTVLSLLDKRAPHVSATIYTQHISQQLQLDIERHNSQYPVISVHQFSKSHDRFLLIDDEVYHIGASIKDLGKKWFAFTRMHDLTPSMLTEHLSERNILPPPIQLTDNQLITRSRRTFVAPAFTAGILCSPGMRCLARMCLALLIPLLLTACDDEGHRAFVALGEMEHESMRLYEQTTDSVLRFRTKFDNFIAKYPNSKDDPRYETIVNNINDCLVTIPINIEIDGGADIMVD